MKDATDIAIKKMKEDNLILSNKLKLAIKGLEIIVSDGTYSSFNVGVAKKTLEEINGIDNEESV